MSIQSAANTNEAAPPSETRADAAAGRARNERATGSDEAITTTDHTRIREWVESRGGRPCHVSDTGGKKDLGILRIDFQEPDEGLEAVPWDNFLRTFEDKNLAFLFKEKTKSGKISRFCKFVSRTD